MRIAGLAAAAALIAGAAQAADGPKVMATSPAVGATVPASTSAISVTYDRPMLPGWSFAGDPAQIPEIVGQPSLSADGRTISVAVRMKPGASYVVWLNSERYKNFKDTTGQAAEPYRLTFSTTN